jgi:large subunit ribosomal protein L21
MRLIRGNVEKESSDEEQIAKLKRDGFTEITADATESSADEIAPAQNIADMTMAELRDMAKQKGLSGYSGLNKEELLSVLKDVV